MVEAPGTAPGSALLISQHVYRHSWKTSKITIGVLTPVSKNSFVFDAVSVDSSIEKDTLFCFGTGPSVWIISLHTATLPCHFNH